MADEAFKRMAQSLARCVNQATGEVYLDNDRAEAALALFLDENAQVFTTFDTLHPGAAADPENVELVKERVQREVALSALAAVHVTDDGTRREGNWDAKVYEGSLIVLGGAR